MTSWIICLHWNYCLFWVLPVICAVNWSLFGSSTNSGTRETPMWSSYRALHCPITELFRLKQGSPVLVNPCSPPHAASQGYLVLISPLLFFSLQGRHVKTGQLAAIKVMDVTEVSKHQYVWTCMCYIKLLSGSHNTLHQPLSCRRHECLTLFLMTRLFKKSHKIQLLQICNRCQN